MASQEGLEWPDLLQTMTRRRELPSRRRVTPDGEIVNNGALGTQSIRGLLQVRKGRLNSQAEGMVPQSSHVFFCNLRPRKDAPAGEMTDVLEGDTLRLEGATRDPDYRVVLVSDAGGQGDHLEIFLEQIKPGGDT